MGAMHAAVHDLDQARHQQDVFLDVLDRTMDAVRRTAESVALIGELASAAFGNICTAEARGLSSALEISFPAPPTPMKCAI